MVLLRSVVFFVAFGFVEGVAWADASLKLSEQDFSRYFGDHLAGSLEQSKLGYNEKEQSVSIDGDCGVCSVIGLKQGDTVLSVDNVRFTPNPMVPPGIPEAGMMYFGIALSQFSKGDAKSLGLKIMRSGKQSTITVTRTSDGRKEEACKPEDMTLAALKKKVIASSACPDTVCTDVAVTEKGKDQIGFAITGRAGGFSELEKIIEALDKIPGFAKVRDTRSDPKGKFIEFVLTGTYSCH